jgi:exodeoxyribonuclease VII small subunit
MDVAYGWDKFTRMKSAKQESGLKFEGALEELEKIVGEMENAELPLEKLIERYELGMRLVKICGDKLSEAEQKVEILTRAKTALEASQPETVSTPPPTTEESDEVRLF